MIATGDFKVSASGRKVRRLIKVGDDDYNKADDIDKDGDVDADDKKLAKEQVELEEATVKSAKYSWGTMKTVHHGKDFSIPLHPEHHKPIAALKHGESHSFKDETGAKWKATREDDTVHFHGGSYGTQKTSVKHDTMKESVELDEAADKQDSRLMQLARLGLLDKSDVATFRTAMQTFKADKQLSIKQRNMLLSVYNDLVNMVTGDDAMFARAKLDIQKEETELEEGKRGLWDNIHAKRKRIAAGSGEKMRKPGSEGAPTAQDFKDAAKTTKEEVEQIDELSKTTLQSYRKKVAKDVGRAYAIHQDPYKKTDKDDMRKLSNRVKGDERAEIGLKKEEVEQIDEISKETLASYIPKAAKDARIHGQIATDFENRGKTARKPGSKDIWKSLSMKYKEKAWKRDDGISKAVNKLTKEDTQIEEGTYSHDVEKAFPASGVKTGASAPKGTSTMPKDKKLAKGQPAGSVGTKTEGYYKDIDTNEKEDKRLGVWKKETPWRKVKPGSDTTVDKSGAVHTPMSKVRHLARLALKKTSSK